ncbi:hypothetical protein G3T36_18455 [Diaminobutyricibacter tongyongensis]|uniref:Uncharacterized protein n=1 Tax=Leifsonia tongyongensis TaxID=1268043 RepID=A0A6L9Y2C7_9MICO|nr:hypothetical protein [Diaminobutyricibacter tongyongensis]NEN07842.1 hypothetical protein [Diaminobutyricibacter tongyongensis]
MNNDWATVHEFAELAGLDGVELAAAAHRRGVSAEAVLEGFHRAIRLRAERGENDPYPFTVFEATPPGIIDLRVLDQAEWWVDQLRTPHRIADRVDFPDGYLANVIRHLMRSANAYWIRVVVYDPAAAESDSLSWIKGTTLMGALRGEASLRLVSALEGWTTVLPAESPRTASPDHRATRG